MLLTQFLVELGGTPFPKKAYHTGITSVPAYIKCDMYTTGMFLFIQKC